jgi:hypothetical protein
MVSTQRNLRIDDELWEGFGHAIASRDPEADRSKAIRRLIRWYAQDPERAEAAMRLSAQTRAAEPAPPELAATVPPPAAARPGPDGPAGITRTAETAPEPARRGPGALTEAQADALIAGLDERAYTKLSRKAKDACESLDHEVYYPVMRQLVIGGWRAPRA